MKHIILLADDSPTIQRLVTQTFVDANFEIVSVSNGDAAIKKFEDVHPDLVLADIYMPGKNGYEVCDYVRRHPERGSTPVVLLAGAFDAFDEGKARQIGASSHITKPFEPRALVDLVVSLISGKGNGQEPQPEAIPATKEVAALAVPKPKPEAEAEPAPKPAEEPVPAAAAKPAPPEPISLRPDPIPAVAHPISTLVSEPKPMPAPAASLAASVPPAPAVVVKPVQAASAAPAPAPAPAAAESADVLGLNDLFKPAAGSVSEEEIDRIADRVIKKLSTQVIESVAWDVVPEITTKIIKDELKRQS